MTLPSLAITGATGLLGGATARALAGEPMRLVVRDAARAPEIEGSAVVVAGYGDATAARAALEGVETLFMVSASESADRLEQHRRFVDAARDAGVAHIVYTSFVGASADCTFTLGRDHWATEQAIRSSGMRFTFLRDNFYADFVPQLVGDDGLIRGPGGTGAAAWVARADVAAVAAAVLREPEMHADRSYDLTGPHALTFDDVAAVAVRELGTPAAFHRETIPEARASRARWNPPEWQMEAWISTYTAIANGELAAVSDDIPALLGRPALSVAEVLRAG